MSTTPTVYPSVPLDEQKIRDLVADCVRAGVRYGLGSKAPSLTAVPGRDFKRIDCSGFVRWVLYQASGKTLNFKDGSVQQHEWIKEHGFKVSDVASGKLKDGRVRIAFLTPTDGGGVGHVVLILNGKTAESCGGIGPCRRDWTGKGWQKKAHVYILEMDTDGAGSE
jgi:cell wall-associated NlpC family hydrolase